jgi:FlaA1/EpsC-like NDP-sugar epimerase
MDLAENMIRLSGHEPGRDIAIEVVGIRPGEKLHEELFNLDEDVSQTRYGRIWRATRPRLDPVALRLGIELLEARVADGDTYGCADVLWRTLNAGREALSDIERMSIKSLVNEQDGHA